MDGEYSRLLQVWGLGLQNRRYFDRPRLPKRFLVRRTLCPWRNLNLSVINSAGLGIQSTGYFNLLAGKLLDSRLVRETINVIARP